MRLRDNIIDLIKVDKIIKSKLAIALNKSYPTIQRYINENSIQLTIAVSMEVLRNELGKSNDELLEN